MGLEQESLGWVAVKKVTRASKWEACLSSEPELKSAKSLPFLLLQPLHWTVSVLRPSPLGVGCWVTTLMLVAPSKDSLKLRL